LYFGVSIFRLLFFRLYFFTVFYFFLLLLYFLAPFVHLFFCFLSFSLYVFSLSFCLPFLAVESHGDPDARPDEDEDLEARAFSVDEIRRMLAAEDIIDLKTVAGLALLQER